MNEINNTDFMICLVVALVVFSPILSKLCDADWF